jgi:hypothetical protein
MRNREKPTTTTPAEERFQFAATREAAAKAGAQAARDIVAAGGMEAVTKPLADEIAKTDAQKPVARMTFDSAHKFEEVPLPEGFEQIVETIQVSDVKATYDKLEKALRIGETRSERGVMLKALDNAETNARLAHRLWMTAKAAYAAWDIDNEVVFSAMWSEANRVLQEEKKNGDRSKQITDADVKSMVASLHADEYKHQEVRRVRVKSMVDSCQNLCENWNQRCKSLNTMLGKER